MPKYVPSQLTKFGHLKPKKKQLTPYQPVPQKLEQRHKIQYHLTPNKKKHVEQVVSTFQYYGRAVDSTTFYAISNIVTQQSKPTKTLRNKQNNFLIIWQLTQMQSLVSMPLI